MKTSIILQAASVLVILATIVACIFSEELIEWFAIPFTVSMVTLFVSTCFVVYDDWKESRP